MSSKRNVPWYDLKIALVPKIASAGRETSFKFTWALMTLCCWLIMSLVNRRALLLDYRALKTPLVFLYEEGTLLLVAASCGYFYTRVVWLHFTKWCPENVAKTTSPINS